MDLGGLLGFSCADLQVGPLSIGWSSCPRQKGVRLDLHQPPMIGFGGWKMVHMGEVLVVVAEPEQVEVMLCSSTITGSVISVGHWGLLVWGLSLLEVLGGWVDWRCHQLLGSLPKLQQSCMGLLVRYHQ